MLKTEKALLELLRLGEATVEVGVRKDGRGGQKHPNSNTKTIAQVAVLQEEGFTHTSGEHVPARPFVRPILRDRRLFRTSVSVLTAAVKQATASQSHRPLLRALDQIGFRYEEAIRSRVGTDRITPSVAPLKESTVAKKGHSTPLVDTKALMRAIESRLVRK